MCRGEDVHVLSTVQNSAFVPLISSCFHISLNSPDAKVQLARAKICSYIYLIGFTAVHLEQYVCAAPHTLGRLSPGFCLSGYLKVYLGWCLGLKLTLSLLFWPNLLWQLQLHGGKVMIKHAQQHHPASAELQKDNFINLKLVLTSMIVNCPHPEAAK